MRRFSQGDFRKDQKRPSGNSLFHDPVSFVLAFGSEIDVYGHSPDRSLSLKRSEANSFVEFLVNSILLLLEANAVSVSLPVHFSLSTPCSASALALDSILFRLCWTWRNLMEACRHGSFLLKSHVALSLRRFSNICACGANRSGRLLHGCCVIWPVVKHGERLSPKSQYAVIAQAFAICSDRGLLFTITARADLIRRGPTSGSGGRQRGARPQIQCSSTGSTACHILVPCRLCAARALS